MEGQPWFLIQENRLHLKPSCNTWQIQGFFPRTPLLTKALAFRIPKIKGSFSTTEGREGSYVFVILQKDIILTCYTTIFWNKCGNNWDYSRFPSVPQTLEHYQLQVPCHVRLGKFIRQPWHQNREEQAFSSHCSQNLSSAIIWYKGQN